jgi:ABC-type multidrug transport system fused ATPase/permease subunit
MGTAYICFGWALVRLWNGYITFGTMVMFITLANSLSSAFSSLVNLVPSGITAATSAGRIMELTNLDAENTDIDENILNDLLSSDSGVSIVAKDLCFNYKGSASVIEHANFIARPKEIIALVGPSGEGKTTIIRLLLGILNKKEGSLKAENGKVSCDLSAATRNLFSYVPQGNTLFGGTIAENLRMVKPDATDDELIDVLKIACAYDFVNKLPLGINSPIGEHGNGFSEGQNQRLSIARAILRNCPVILFDEATSALDVTTERQVLKNVMAHTQNQTCIVTTHRPSVLTLCSRVYKVSQSNICEISAEEIEVMIKDF